MKQVFKDTTTPFELNYQEFPILNISKISIKTSDKNWLNRFYSAKLMIKMIAINNDNPPLSIATKEEPLNFSNYISSQHTGFDLSINRYYKLEDDNLPNDELKSHKLFKFIITLHNIDLNSDEEIIVEYMDNAHVKKRVDDWEHRVSSLIEQIRNWNIDNIDIRASRNYLMHEGLMKQFNVPMRQILSVNVFQNDILKIAIKPFGLWIMGANGRIDLLTQNGNNVLVDEAQQFDTPKWKLYPLDNKKTGVDFNKNEFIKLLNQ